MISKPLIGFCPIGKFAFSHSKAMEQKKEIQSKLIEYGINFCSIDGVIPDGMVRSEDHVNQVVEYFKSKKIDSLFIPHCNFGTEGAAALISDKLKVPVLLYGPRDEAPLPDGTRLTDTLCGLFATSKVLRKLNIPFTYIENCTVNDEKFHKEICEFERVSSVIKAMKNIRIGQIGGRIDFFWCTIIDEADILKKFNIQLQPIDMVNFIRDVKIRAKENIDKYRIELKKYSETVINTDGLPETGFINGLAARDQMREMAQSMNLDGFAVQGFPSLCEALGEGGELGFHLIQNEMPIGAETDVLGVVSSIILRAAASNNEPAFLPEWTSRHPSNDNAVLLWHGNCPLSLKKPLSPKAEILASWILPTKQRTNIAYPIKDGEITVCRLEGENGKYNLGIGRGKTVEGPRTTEVYTWLEVADWSKYERKLIEGPYLHHCSCIFDNCADVLKEACKFIPYLEADDFDE